MSIKRQENNLFLFLQWIFFLYILEMDIMSTLNRHEIKKKCYKIKERRKMYI